MRHHPPEADGQHGGGPGHDPVRRLDRRRTDRDLRRRRRIDGYRRAARARSILERHRWLYWTAAATMLAIGAASYQARANALDRARSQWGDAITVWVASADLHPGDDVKGNSTPRRVPAEIVPEAALLEAEGTVTQRVARGSILTNVSVTASTDALALAPPGTVVVGVRQSVPVGASAGESVAVVSEGVMIAARAVVVGIENEIVLLALPIDEAPVVSAASDGRSVALLRLVTDKP